ncbi:hypothetical protein R1sor_015017 [Riccia sorocarpa]|uniref:Gamma-glutamylcyclotransferase family protein n=1 Tax=Riccia sorocarpa TaxID=122646 RepID=A0ABD3HBC5_9MARC
MSIVVSAASCHLSLSRCSAPSVTVRSSKKETHVPTATRKISVAETKTEELSVNAPQKAVDGKAGDAFPTVLAFVYGTLKRGFGNHWLMEEQMSKRHARLVGTAQTKLKYPLVCGPFQVPFLLSYPGEGEHVQGELYEIDNHCLERLDELEGVSKRHYERCPVSVTRIELDPSFKFSLQNGLNGFSATQGYSLMDTLVQPEEVKAEAYFAHEHYTPGMYRAPHLKAYTEKEAATYIRRIHRPQNRTFLEHVYHWIEEEEHKKKEVVINGVSSDEEQRKREVVCTGKPDSKGQAVVRVEYSEHAVQLWRGETLW